MTDLVVHQQQQQNNIDTNNTTGFITDDKLMIQVPEFSTDQEHTVYYINVSYEQIHWTVFRRYSQFSELNESLIFINENVKKICPLPTKTYLSPNPKGKGFLNKRREGLETYLKTLIKIPNILEVDDLQSFLGITKNLHIPRSKTSKSMEEFKWVHRTGGHHVRGRSILQSPVYNNSNDNTNNGSSSLGCNLL